MFIKKEDQTGMNLSKLSIILATIGVFALIAGCLVISVTFLAFSAMSAIINFSNLPQANKKRKESIIVISLMSIALISAVMDHYILMILIYLILSFYLVGIILMSSKAHRRELLDSANSDIKTVFGELYGLLVIISTAGSILAFSVLKEYLLAVFMFIMLLAEIFAYLFVAMPEKKQKTLLNTKTVSLMLISFISILILTLYYIELLEIAMLLIIIISIAYCVYKAYMFRND